MGRVRAPPQYVPLGDLIKTSGQKRSPVHTINTASFEEWLGRSMYVAGALEYERPFLSPLYSFLSLHPRGAVRKVRAYVKYFLRYLSRQVSLSRYNCAMMSLGYSPSGGRSGKSRQDRDRWLGTRI